MAKVKNATVEKIENGFIVYDYHGPNGGRKVYGETPKDVGVILETWFTEEPDPPTKRDLDGPRK